VYKRQVQKGFKIVGAFDADQAKVGTKIEGVTIKSVDELIDFANGYPNGIDIGIIATQAPSAQVVANLLVDAGIRAIINFAPVTIEVPDGVVVRQVDLSVELQILSYYLHKV
jgi:redox-sensing transcriptional repressor